MTVTIGQVKPSADIRAELGGQRVLLAFSRGKDSLSAWLALQEAGVEVVPYHMYLIPHLRFVDESIAMYEDIFQTHIIQVPSPSIYRWLNKFVFCPPERVNLIYASDLPNVDYSDIRKFLREDYAEPDTWVCDGVRACDSPQRRIAMATHGPVNRGERTMSVIWDWQIADVRAMLAKHKMPLPVEYEWFGRSYDGLDRRFLEPLSEHAPDDYERVLEWFPLAQMELMRPHLEPLPTSATPPEETA